MRNPETVKRAQRLRKEPTLAERLMWERLRRNALNGWGFRRQAPLGQFVVDFVCHDPPLVVELDGPIHRKPEQAAFDAERDRIVRQLGYVVLRIDEKIVRERTDTALAMITEIGIKLVSNRRPSEAR